MDGETDPKCPAMPPQVLIVEDDDALAAQLARHLDGAGLRCQRFADGAALSDDHLRGAALVVLDLMLPTVHGFDVLRRIRRASDVPVLIVSARNETLDKIRGLKLGADDYLTKPFWPEEFVERVRARLRRPILGRSDGVQIGPLRISRERREVSVDGQAVALTRVEFELLAALSARPGAALTRLSLVQSALDGEGDERTLDVHISRLRKKLGVAGLIETVWGIGYRLGPDRGA